MGNECNNMNKTQIMTIEERLKLYTENKSSGDSERYEVMWHAWKHNKRWISQLLEWILPSFPMYSRHGHAHAVSILHSIEMILGAEQIACLSASDCFLLLHVVYIHDIGMCITHDDRKELMQNEKFINFLEENRLKGNDVMRKYAELLLGFCDKTNKELSKSDMLATKLNVYCAILYLVAEYRRKEHSEQSKKLLDDWIDKPDKLGIGFSTSGLPSRFFYTVGASASVHNSYNFDDVMALDKIDTGYCHDYMHPRFAAVMLQLGDALDLDNDRFHPLVKDFMGELPPESGLHFEKHMSIRRLRISSDKISIRANCKSAEALQLVSVECENIKDILRNASYYWSAICPEALSVCLPEFEPEELLLNGQPVKEGLVNVRFKIQQKKAFNLLQGSNIYKEDDFVFLREIFQNAIDASKIQYWNDWKGSRWYTGKESEKLDISKMGRLLSPVAYPVKVELHLACKEKYGKRYKVMDLEDDQNKVKKDLGNEIITGVLVKVFDHGTGMTADDIKEIADVGSSYEKKKRFVDEMPQWLLPTAEFGIGLQAAFLAADFMVAYTYTRTGEKYKVEFEATGDRGKGYICVTPLKEEGPRTFGTQFEIFVANEKKRKHQDDLESWSGKDPYENGYDAQCEIRRARELEIQLALYLESLVGELLFPIKLHVYDFAKCSEESFVESKLSGKIQKLDCSIFCNGEHYENSEKENSEIDFDSDKEELVHDEERLTWVYRLHNKEDLITGIVNNDFHYALDLKKIKLYLWNSISNVYACFGAERLQALRKLHKGLEIDRKMTETKIFYKGVYVCTFSERLDLNLLEYIDIKGKLDREYLAINRGDFTKKGYAYVRYEIYNSIVTAAHEALEECDNKIVSKEEKTDKTEKQESSLTPSEKIEGKEDEKSSKNKVLKKLELLIEDESMIYEKSGQKVSRFNRKASAERIQTAIFSAIGLATFAQIRSAGTCLIPNIKETCNNWNQLLKEISRLIEKKKENNPIGWTDSSFFKIQFNKMSSCQDEENKMKIETGNETNIADIMYGFNKYAIVSKRNSENSSWEEYLIAIRKGSDDLNGTANRCSACGAENDDETIKDNIMALKNQWVLKDRKKTIEKIETWGENFRAAFDRFAKEEQGKERGSYQQHQIIGWLLENIPSIALFTDKDSNLRVNIMDLEHTDSMYFDRNFKWNIYERMLETYESKGIERFSTVAFTGYCRLALQKNPSSVYFVKRGNFSRIGQRYNIIPFNAKTLKEIFEIKRKYDVDDDICISNPVWKHFCGFSKYVEDNVKKYAEMKCSENNAEVKSAAPMNILNEKFGQKNFDNPEGEQKNSEDIAADIKNYIGRCIKIRIDEMQEIQLKPDHFDNDKSSFSHFILEETDLKNSFLKLLKWILREDEQEPIEEETEGKLTIKDIMCGYKTLFSYDRYFSKEECKDNLFEEHILETVKISCGLKKSSNNSEKSASDCDTMNRLIETVSENSWIKLPKEQSKQLYDLYVSEVVDELFDKICDEMLCKLKGNYLMKTLLKNSSEL